MRYREQWTFWRLPKESKPNGGTFPNTSLGLLTMPARGDRNIYVPVTEVCLSLLLSN